MFSGQRTSNFVVFEPAGFGPDIYCTQKNKHRRLLLNRGASPCQSRENHSLFTVFWYFSAFTGNDHWHAIFCSLDISVDKEQF